MIKMKKVLTLVCAIVLMLLPLTAMASTTKYVDTQKWRLAEHAQDAADSHQ